MATTFKLKRKLYFLDEQGNAVTGAEVLAKRKAQGGTAKDALSSIKSSNTTNYNINSQAKQATSNYNKLSTNKFKSMAKQGNTQGIANLKQSNAVKGAKYGAYKAGFAKGQSSVGVRQGMRNTWNRMGRAGKIGTIAGGLALGGLALKGAKDAVD